MYKSSRIYGIVPDETLWHAIPSMNGRYVRYYIYRRIGTLKHRIYVGASLNVERIAKKIKSKEEKLGLPPDLRTDTERFVLIEVKPKTGVKPRKFMAPAETSWEAKTMKNSKNIMAFYLFRQIGRKTYRMYWGTKADLKKAKEKILKLEDKLGLQEKERTDLENLEIKMLA